jgi:hypothetical protein
MDGVIGTGGARRGEARYDSHRQLLSRSRYSGRNRGSGVQVGSCSSANCSRIARRAAGIFYLPTQYSAIDHPRPFRKPSSSPALRDEVIDRQNFIPGRLEPFGTATRDLAAPRLQRCLNRPQGTRSPRIAAIPHTPVQPRKMSLADRGCGQCAREWVAQRNPPAPSANYRGQRPELWNEWEEVRFAPDSALEEGGFELVVPL